MGQTPSYTVAPPTTAPTNTISDCTNWVVAASTDTCASLAADNELTMTQFYDYNPSLAPSGCPIIVGDSYCIEENWGIPPTSSAASSVLTTTTSTPTGDGVTTPSPIQTGMITTCDEFYYVQGGIGCAQIASNYSISLAQLYAWNPAVGSDCGSLWASTYLCVGILGQSAAPTVTATTTTAATSSTTTTTAGNGIATPTPTQPGMVSNCDVFHYVVSGDGCASLAAQYGISLTQFYTWNPDTDQCVDLWLDAYACVGVVGVTPTPTTSQQPSSTSTGNGVTTPTPYESGMVSNCDEFHYVVMGDSCQSVASAADISLSNFYLWNPSVGDTCASLWLDAYVCIGIL